MDGGEGMTNRILVKIILLSVCALVVMVIGAFVAGTWWHASKYPPGPMMTTAEYQACDYLASRAPLDAAQLYNDTLDASNRIDDYMLANDADGINREIAKLERVQTDHLALGAAVLKSMDSCIPALERIGGTDE